MMSISAEDPPTSQTVMGPHESWSIGRALREAFRGGYGWADLKADLLAGMVVGIVALPLSMALAIASGVPPQHGLYTAIVAGAIIALAGGSSVQVSGPTAAFVVILAPMASQYGLNGLLVASLMAGAILIALGIAGMGRLIEFIPYPVTTGFTAGIALVIATLQLRDFFGLNIADLPDHFHERIAALFTAAGTAHAADTAIGILTLALLALVPRLTRIVPAPLVALVAAAVAAYVWRAMIPGVEIATLQSRFGGIPQMLPAPSLPWQMPADAPPIELGALIGPAFAIAMLGAIESLLSAVVADGMTGRKHCPNTELIAQGLGNVAAPFFGGFAATGAIARTATNIRAGARGPLSAVFHSVFILGAMVLFAPILGYLPMAALAGLLLRVAWNMSEARHAVRVLRIAPRSDAVVLAACFVLTVVFDMVVAVSVGVVLAALLFMRRMAELATFRLLGAGHPELSEPLPGGVLLYDVGGPLFFGAAQRAASALQSIRSDVRLVLLDMRDVPSMDATGLVNLESALAALHKARVFVIIGGVQDQPLHLMARAGWKHRQWLVVLRSFDEALLVVRSIAPSDLGGPSATDDLHTAAAHHQPGETKA